MKDWVLTIRNVAAKKGLFAFSSYGEEKKPADSTVLVFKRYGNLYFLSEIKLKGSNRTYRLPESREGELRAQNAPASEQTLLASIK